jgi:hypothetical protein
MSHDGTLSFQNAPLTADPKLEPLANYGGPTQTHQLAAGSVAIAAGSSINAGSTDQRGAGYPRSSGGSTDIGAIERDEIFPNGFQ